MVWERHTPNCNETVQKCRKVYHATGREFSVHLLWFDQRSTCKSFDAFVIINYDNLFCDIANGFLLLETIIIISM